MTDGPASELPARIGKFEILSELGRGGMGLVYKARDPGLDRLVAVKVIKLAFAADEDLAREMRERFEREAKAAATIASPNIVTVYDYGEDQGLRYIAMEFVEGVPLDEMVSPGELLPLRQVNSIVRQVAEGLAYAHGQGIVHRDIKPANVLITRDGTAKITDFGIARIPGSTLTQQNVTLGSPSYMSPEQVGGERPVDHRSDIFALGAVLYQLLTGERPFPGENAAVISYRIVEVEPPAPSVLNPMVPPAYDLIVKKALAKNPDQRYASAKEMADDLARAADGVKLGESSPVKPAGPSPAQLLLASLQKPWAKWAGLALVVLAAAAGLVAVSLRVSNPYNEVEKFMVGGRHDQAIAALLKIRLTKPKDPRVYILLGREYATIGDHRSSLLAYHQALLLKPEARADEKLRAELMTGLARADVADLAVQIIVSTKLKEMSDQLKAAINDQKYDHTLDGNALEALEGLGEKVDQLPLYIMDLNYNEDCAIRKTAVEEMGKLANPLALPALNSALNDRRNRSCMGRAIEEAKEKINAANPPPPP